MTPGTPSPARLSRRGLARGGLLMLAVGVAGCDNGGGASPAPAAAPAGSGSPSGSPADDPDERLLLDALDAETAMRARLERAARHDPRLRRSLSGALRVHGRHRDLLRTAVAPVAAAGSSSASAPDATGGEPGGRGQDGRGGGSAAGRLAALARAERALAERLATLTLAAESGQVARLLGALSAAAAQQGQVLARADVAASGPGSGS